MRMVNLMSLFLRQRGGSRRSVITDRELDARASSAQKALYVLEEIGL